MAFVNASTKRQNDSQATQDHCSVSEYQNTAYNSEDFPPQKPRPEKGFLRRMMTSGKPFSFSQTTDSITVYGLDDMTPTVMAEEEKSSKPMYWTEAQFIGESLSGWSQLYFLIVGIAKMCLMGLLPLFYVICLIGLFLGKGGALLAGMMVGMIYLLALLCTRPYPVSSFTFIFFCLMQGIFLLHLFCEPSEYLS